MSRFTTLSPERANDRLFITNESGKNITDLSVYDASRKPVIPPFRK